MAHLYVYSGAAGAGTGADWANAYTTLAAAVDDGAGNDVWVAHDHAEAAGGAAAITLASAGTIASPVKIHCVNRAGSVPPVAADLATTATITTTNAFGITRSGYAYCYGITFNCSSGITGASFADGSTLTSWFFESCIINIVATGASIGVVSGNASGAAGLGYSTKFKNCTFTFGGLSQFIFLRGGKIEIEGGSIAATGTIPTTLFQFTTTQPWEIEVRGADLSTFTTGKTLVAAAPVQAPILLENCKLHATPPTLIAVPTVLGVRARVNNCDGGDTNYTNHLITYQGTRSVETTIVMTGGASDGTTPISRKIVTTANVVLSRPFRDDPIIVWNEDTGAGKTATIEGVWGGGAVPTNAEIWIEVEYLGTSGSTKSSFVTNGQASQIATATNQGAGTGTWGGGTTTFKMTSPSFTPAEKGPILIRVCAAKASETFYYDPQPALA